MHWVNMEVDNGFVCVQHVQPAAVHYWGVMTSKRREGLWVLWGHQLHFGVCLCVCMRLFVGVLLRAHGGEGVTGNCVWSALSRAWLVVQHKTSVGEKSMALHWSFPRHQS